jgi:hypothetical protein
VLLDRLDERGHTLIRHAAPSGTRSELATQTDTREASGHAGKAGMAFDAASQAMPRPARPEIGADKRRLMVQGS